MKIIFLSKFLTQGGSALHQYSLATTLIKMGHEVCIVSSGPINNEIAKKKFEESKQYGIKHFHIKFPHKYPSHILSKLYLLIRYMIVIPKFCIFIFRYKPDLIHVHYPVTSYLAKLCGILFKKKFVSTYHIGGIPKHILHYKADYAIAISNELKEELIGRLEYKEEQVFLINNGVSSRLFDNKPLLNRKKILKKMGIPINKVIIGFVGAFNERKGLDILLKALRGIDEDIFHLVLLGDGNTRWLESLINENHLKGKVSIFSFQNPYIFYQLFSFFILPSRREGFPLVVIEAMMMGLPIIRSNTQGASEQVKHGENGFLFENENSDELQFYCMKLLRNEKLRIEMGKKSREIAINRFTEDVMAKKTLELYSKVKG